MFKIRNDKLIGLEVSTSAGLIQFDAEGVGEIPTEESYEAMLELENFFPVEDEEDPVETEVEDPVETEVEDPVETEVEDDKKADKEKDKAKEKVEEKAEEKAPKKETAKAKSKK